MGKRNTARRLAMQCIYQYEIKDDEFQNIVQDTIEDANFVEDTKSFATELANQIYAKLPEIDSIIKEKSIDWSFDRMAKIDKSVLRVAICELLLGDTPESVVINEAVEIAKKYSSKESSNL